MAFDEDCDEVLTIEEIKDGCKFNKINLLDIEMAELVKAIDSNHDGVVTRDEWTAIL